MNRLDLSALFRPTLSEREHGSGRSAPLLSASGSPLTDSYQSDSEESPVNGQSHLLLYPLAPLRHVRTGQEPKLPPAKRRRLAEDHVSSVEPAPHSRPAQDMRVAQVPLSLQHKGGPKDLPSVLKNDEAPLSERATTYLAYLRTALPLADDANTHNTAESDQPHPKKKSRRGRKKSKQRDDNINSAAEHPLTTYTNPMVTDQDFAFVLSSMRAEKDLDIF